MAITAPPHPAPLRAAAAPAADAIPQYSLRKILGVWASAMIPMGLLAWVVAPWLAGHIGVPIPFANALILSLTAVLVWLFVLVMFMLARKPPSSS